MRTETAPKIIYLKDYKAPDYLVKKLDLLFRIQDGKTIVTSTALYYRQGQAGHPALVLDGEHMSLLSVKMDGQDCLYDKTDTTLTIQNLPAEFTLEIITEFNPSENTALEGLYQSGDMVCTQCEAQGFRRITYFQDRPDVMTVFTTRIEADKNLFPVLLSNGNLVKEGAMSDNRHFAEWHDPFPKPCYLFALVAGKLDFIQDSFTTMSGRKVDLRIYARQGDQDQCHYAMESLIRSMKWDEDTYGREYQLDKFNIVAVSDFNMGAMENTSLNIFNTALVLAHPETATDLDFYRVESVIGHEYFHNWTGNRVTCRDWFQLSLKEGLTVYRDQEFSADMNSRSVQRIDDVEGLRSMQFPEDSGPLAHPVRPDSYIEINNFYTTTVYEKGAEVVRMQATLLGPKLYRKATDLYFARHDGQAVTCDDFVKCMEDVSRLDLSQFKLWYSQAGTPEVTAKTHYDESKKQVTLSMTQRVPDTHGQTNKKPHHIPVAVGLLDSDGKDMITTQILHLKEKSQNFIFDNIPQRPIPSILRNYSAPVRLTTDLSEDDLRFLMVKDSDGFNRWEAAQTLTLRLINRMLDQAEAGHMVMTDRAYLDSVGQLLAQALDRQEDKALLARMIALPEHSIISQERSVIYPEHIHGVVTRIKYDILSEYSKTLGELYKKLNQAKPFTPDAPSMAERSLKSVVMDIFTCDGGELPSALCKKHYFESSNMTDRMMALNGLLDTDSGERAEVLADFYKRFKDFPLVIDKWFGAQARAIRPQTLDDIRLLAAHPDFNLKNPNRARSLYGTFAMRNPVIFHSRSGDGYNLFGQVILTLDKINPQIASRLLTSLREWRRYDSERQAKMKIVLQDIVKTKDLSPNVFEIANKTLGE
jgi:aminopeptidase N